MKTSSVIIAKMTFNQLIGTNSMHVISFYENAPVVVELNVELCKKFLYFDEYSIILRITMSTKISKLKY